MRIIVTTSCMIAAKTSLKNIGGAMMQEACVIHNVIVYM